MARFLGTPGMDTLTGTPSEDRILALAGDDLLLGLAGHDLLEGGGDNDTLLGGKGMDVLEGGSGDDVLAGEAGHDTLFGGTGNDGLDGGSGDDQLDAGDGNDIVDGNSGNDTLLAGGGDDAVRGDDGDDRLAGDAGNDVILGEAGDDLVQGGDGDDVLDGDTALRIFGLTNQNQLISIDPNRPDQVDQKTITGIDGNLLGIDVRPANGLLYGITDTQKIYQIDGKTGTAQFVSMLDVPFNGGQFSGVDFNPVPDRLRLVGSNNDNFRVNVDTGMVADFDPNTPGTQPDRPLAYAPGDPNAGQDPAITAAAYTNSFAPSPAPTRQTTLYAIDSNLDTLVRQGGLNSAPPSPNEGQLFTIGDLGVNFDANSGFDILSSPNGMNVAIAVSGATLYQIDLGTGAAKLLGVIGDGTHPLIGLAVTGVTDLANQGDDTLIGDQGNDLLSGGGGKDTLRGKTGNDTLQGGMDDDLLTGGTGNDIIVFSSNSPFSSAQLGVDRIRDFTPGVDQILLDQTIFEAITADQIAIVSNDAAVATNAGLIVYSTATGNLFFNANETANGLGAGGQFATFDRKPTLTAANFAIVP